MLARSRRVLAVLLIVSCALALYAQSGSPARAGVARVGAEKRNITEKDLFQFVWIGDPQVSPDGARVAFVRVTVNEKKDGYDTAIWSVPTADGAAFSAPQPLTSGKHDSTPRWSPDGKYLVFARSVEEAGGRPGKPQLYFLALSGGEAQQLTSLPRGVSNPVWSPDGSQIAFSSDMNSDDVRKEDVRKQHEREARERRGGESSPSTRSSERREAPRTEGSENAQKEEQQQGQTSAFNPEHESDVRVITRAVYRSNGQGYLDPTHPDHIWVIGFTPEMTEKPVPRQLTSGKYEEGQMVWSKDGHEIYFASSHIDEPYYQEPSTTLFAVRASGGEPRTIANFDFGAHSFSLSPDGTRLAFRGSRRVSPVQSYTQPDLWVIERKPGATAKNLRRTLDYDVGSGVGGDNAPPRGAGQSRPLWSSDGRNIIDVVAKEGRANLYYFDAASGAASEFTRGDHAIESFNMTHDGHVIAMVSTPTMVGDLFVFDPPLLQTDSKAAPRRITNVNEKLFSQLNLTEPEEIWYTSFDGKKIQTWVQKPPNFDAKKKYPLILDIHGGPHGAYGYVFDHEFQWMAAKGYVVLYPNPRGSTSYGEQFGNIIQYHYPGDDFRDLMAGVDEVIKRGYVDAKKLGVTGGSGGGVLTDWVVGHTDRFAAAVAQRDIADWTSWWYTADFTLFQPTWFKGPPFEQEEDFKSRSPITYINNVKTPMLFVLGEADYRTPPTSGGEQMFRALKYRHIPTVMVRFPGESHELSRSGQPWHRIERLQHIVFWMDKWLMGRVVPAYRDATATAQPASATPPRN